MRPIFPSRRYGRHVTKLIIAGTVAMLTMTSACGGQEAPQSETEPTAQPAPQGTVEPTEPPTGATPPADGGGQVLTATVGQEGNPDAFAITLTDSAGSEVTSLPAGEYEVQVADLSKIHNFHLTGPGVEEKTEVPEVTEAAWTVTLQAGEYTFVCDPHPQRMMRTFTVT